MRLRVGCGYVRVSTCVRVRMCVCLCGCVVVAVVFDVVWGCAIVLGGYVYASGVAYIFTFAYACAGVAVCMCMDAHVTGFAFEFAVVVGCC